MNVKLWRAINTKKAFFKGELILTRMDIKDSSQFINFDFIKKYYVWCINSHSINKIKVFGYDFLMHTFFSFPLATYKHLLIPKTKCTFIIMHNLMGSTQHDVQKQTFSKWDFEIVLDLFIMEMI